MMMIGFVSNPQWAKAFPLVAFKAKLTTQCEGRVRGLLRFGYKSGKQAWNQRIDHERQTGGEAGGGFKAYPQIVFCGSADSRRAILAASTQTAPCVVREAHATADLEVGATYLRIGSW